MHYYMIPKKYDIPYVLFEHDIHSLRANLTEWQTRTEKEMLESAAGIIFTSEDHLAYCRQTYPNMTTNTGIVHLRPLKKDLAFEPLPKLDGKHLIYAGGLTSSPSGNYGYRGYHKIFKAFIDSGWAVHLYGNRYIQYDITSGYASLGCTIHKWVPYGALLQEASQYTAGLQVFNKDDGVPLKAFEYTQTCRPNKTWDYLAAGIPTIGLNPGNCAKIYIEGGWGVKIEDTSPKTLSNLELPDIPPGLRFEQNMDRDIPEFDRVIKIALGLKRHVIKVIETEGEIKVDLKKWHIVEKTVVEKGRILYGKGRRITMSEAERLNLVPKDTPLKDKLQKKQREAVGADVEIKPLDTTKIEASAVTTDQIIDGGITADRIVMDEIMSEDEKDHLIDKFLDRHPEDREPVVIGVDLAKGEDKTVTSKVEVPKKKKRGRGKGKTKK